MRKYIDAALVALALGTVLLTGDMVRQHDAHAQVTGQRSVPLGYQQIATLTTAQSLTVPAGATTAVFVPEAQAVRYRDDGTDPTASVGQPVAVAAVVVYTGTLSAVRVIEQTSGAKLNVLYYR